jgi:hypothetical protein
MRPQRPEKVLEAAPMRANSVPEAPHWHPTEVETQTAVFARQWWRDDGGQLQDATDAKDNSLTHANMESGTVRGGPMTKQRYHAL